MTPLIALLVSLVPSILLFLNLYNDRNKDEGYRSDCRGLFWSGLLSAVFVTVACLILDIAWSLIGIKTAHPLINQLFRAFIIAATVEECAKFVVVRPYFRKNRDTLTRLDVLTYLSISALSFGMLESVVYLFESNIGQILVKGFLLGHVGYGMIMGLLYGKGLAENKMIYKVLALLVPILLHGSYDFCLKDDVSDVLAVIVVTGTFLMTVFIIYMIFFIGKKRRDPAYNTPLMRGADVIDDTEQR
ncbi:MAG: PrsW family intramembrane metalloprotease [Erysipelotrichaceae bacterium]|nr:PrsW family intramembrane metalloprotease [Erysipelotrichaceae bacterium]